MNYTPDMLPSPDRIVPHDEGMARLAEIRRVVEAMQDDAEPLFASLRARKDQQRAELNASLRAAETERAKG